MVVGEGRSDRDFERAEYFSGDGDFGTNQRRYYRIHRATRCFDARTEIDEMDGVYSADDFREF